MPLIVPETEVTPRAYIALKVLTLTHAPNILEQVDGSCLHDESREVSRAAYSSEHINIEYHVPIKYCASRKRIFTVSTNRC